MQLERLHALDYALGRDPDNPLNLLLRGEYWLEAGDPARAEADLVLARQKLDEARQGEVWGYLHQAHLDRLEQLLARIT